MQPLDRDIRRSLESAVKQARDIAEGAARAALEQLGVGAAKAPAYLDAGGRDLRNRLRAHGRQLGDARNAATGVQAIDLLVEEVAYQHWHRMLFARFLAENSLLMYPDSTTPVPVTLDDCAELAASEGVADAWELAARYASHMLPQIFRPLSPVFALHLPPERRQALERLIEGLNRAVFTAADSLGWVYQFWQSKKKDEVNASEVKIGARELPAVTQLFTEPYMVAFLLDNALGAWWVGRAARQDDPTGPELRPGARRMLAAAESEEQLRAFFALPGVPLSYLRFVRGEDGTWRPAAGWFEGWPHDLADFRMIDPCCGSGHFLVAVLLMLAPMRAELEGLAPAQAVDATLRRNIHGLEIDERCVEIAAFALAFAAWRYPGAGGYRPLPPLNLACSGLAISGRKDEWLALAQAAADETVAEQAPALLPDIGKESLWHTQLKAGMSALYDLFGDAPVLGSLINPNRVEGDFFTADYGEVASLLQKMLSGEDGRSEQYEMGVVAQGAAQAAALLADTYDLVATNVSYLSRGRFGDVLLTHVDFNYPDSGSDLATAFLERCLQFSRDDAATAIVLPQNWLFLTTNRKLRRKLLTLISLHLLCRLGAGAFDTISGEVVKAIMLITGSKKPNSSQLLYNIDVSEYTGVARKSTQLQIMPPEVVLQKEYLGSPDSIIVSGSAFLKTLIGEVADSYHGITTTDYPRFGRVFWELHQLNDGWVFQQSTVAATKEYSGKSNILLWENGNGGIRELQNAGRPVVITGLDAWGKYGVSINQMNELNCTLYTGVAFDTNVAVLVPHNEDQLPALWCFCSSEEFNKAVRQINQKMNVEYVYFVKVPFDLAHWQQVAAERYPDGLPKPYASDPTQWIFHGHPAGCDAPLQAAVARLLGYRWPAELDAGMELSDEARR